MAGESVKKSQRLVMPLIVEDEIYNGIETNVNISQSIGCGVRAEILNFCGECEGLHGMHSLH